VQHTFAIVNGQSLLPMQASEERTAMAASLMRKMERLQVGQVGTCVAMHFISKYNKLLTFRTRAGFRLHVRAMYASCQW
jgi:hypothetical protein